MTYRVVIPTAGIGSRLEKLTKHINKSLVAIANRPIMSHLIEQFPNLQDRANAVFKNAQQFLQALE